MFLPYAGANCYNADEATLIASNGGRNDVRTINMWALFGPAPMRAGAWGFFSPCTAANGAYTTSMVGVGACNQDATLDPATGAVAEVSASGGYMVSQCALPFAAPGHMRGLTLARQGEGQQAADALTIAGARWHTSLDTEFDGTTIVPVNEQVSRFNGLALDRVPGQRFAVASQRWGKQRGEWGQNRRTKERGVPLAACSARAARRHRSSAGSAGPRSCATLKAPPS